MKTTLITGASSGIGRATAKKLLGDGCIVYGAARRVEEMEDLEERGATALEMDVTRESDVTAVVDRITADEGGIDVLINNAGFGLYGAVEDVPLDEARYQFEVNLFGLGRLTQLALPHMREQRSGTIVNVSSMGGRIYTPLGAWYHASRHALEGWSDCLRLELAPFDVDVVVIEPGVIETEFSDTLLQPMLDRSGDGPYSDLAHSVAEGTRDSYGDGDATPPAVIADVISRALKADRPRTRYVAGRLAKPLMALRKWGGDRVFDWALRSQLDSSRS